MTASAVGLKPGVEGHFNGGWMAHRLEGTVALVTGASTGIGAAIARGLAAEAAAVLLARRQFELKALAERIADEGGTARGLGRHRPGAGPGAVEQVADGLGRIDIAVNNAGTTAPARRRRRRGHLHRHPAPPARGERVPLPTDRAGVNR